MSASHLHVHNARQNNLKGVTVDIPHRTLTVVTGPSGSGKSSLAFDTLYAEGQRRYIESLSTYAKQFLERMPKPEVDRLDGIAPSVAIEQRNPATSARSTVGTATEVHDFLRLLWARIGQPHCAGCGGPITSQSPGSAADHLLVTQPGGAVVIAFPLPRSEHPDHQLIVENLLAMGFVRVIVDGSTHRVDGLPDHVRLDAAENVLVAVDRVTADEHHRNRLSEAVAIAFAEGEGTAVSVGPGETAVFTEHPQCARCGQSSPRLTPTLFSFNSPRGACPACNGFGAILEYDEDLIVPDTSRSLNSGAIDPWTKPRYTSRRRMLKEFAVREGIPTDRAWHDLDPDHRKVLLHKGRGRFTPIFSFLRDLERKRYKQYIRVFLRQYQRAVTCPDCLGMRLGPDARAVTLAGASIGQIGAETIDHLDRWLAEIELTVFEREVAQTILDELQTRVRFLVDVGLGYLTLDRQTRTLSGGEAQRIALANALGARLVDTLYVLDEPSIGLHARDLDRLLGLLRRLRDAGNTVVVVEHDLEAVRTADFMVELGPGSGAGGGELVFAGPPSGAVDAETLTGAFLGGVKHITVPASRRPVGSRWIDARGARLHNLEGVDIRIPLGTMTVVTGVSGSGKSTLVHDVLYRQLASRLHGRHGAKEHLGEQVGTVDTLSGWEQIDDVVVVDQTPIGRSPRSNPITYIRAFDEIRQLFARQPLATARGYSATTFSFNAADGGRCPACDGAGHQQIEMVFLADVFVPCEQCGGARFDRPVLDVKIKGLSVADVLDLTVDEAIVRFRHQDTLGRALWHLQQVGLGYLRLGQPATTLSGGEAQRLKIARQLASASRRKERRLYILDEPTTGLHLNDVNTLLRVLDRLVDAGHSVLIIEHHLDVIKRADWVIDMGPDGGTGGGQVVASGTPEQVADAPTHTGRFLHRALGARTCAP